MSRIRVWGLATAALLTPACSDDGVPQGEDSSGDTLVGGGGSTTFEGDVTSGLSGTTADPDGSDSNSDPEGDDGPASSDSTSGGAPLGPGCGLPYEGESVVTGQVDVDGQPRTFVLSMPEGYDPNVPTPLVFAWHGLGGTGNLARLYFGVEEAAAGAAIFVYPDALPQGAFGGETGWDLLASGDDVAFFDALLAELDGGLCLDHGRLFSTGHSFGGYMSNTLACFRPEVLRAIAPVAGGPPPVGACGDARVAAWITHGTLDEVVPFSEGQGALEDQLERNACGETSVAVDPEPCVTYDGCDPDHPVTWCPHDLPDQSGHAWPPFAGDAIWTFFSALAPSASP